MKREISSEYETSEENPSENSPGLNLLLQGKEQQHSLCAVI